MMVDINIHISNYHYIYKRHADILLYLTMFFFKYPI